MFNYVCNQCGRSKKYNRHWSEHPDRIEENLSVILRCINACDGLLEYTPDKYQVSMNEIDYQRRVGWFDFDPEDYCHRCGNRNCVWWTDSDRFNLAIDAHGVDSNYNGIICIPCFVELHEEKTNLKTAWKLEPGMFKGV